MESLAYIETSFEVLQSFTWCLEFGVLRGIFRELREQAVTIKRLKLLFLQIKTRIAFTTFVGTGKTNYKKNKSVYKSGFMYWLSQLNHSIVSVRGQLLKGWSSYRESTVVLNYKTECNYYWNLMSLFLYILFYATSSPTSITFISRPYGLLRQ